MKPHTDPRLTTPEAAEYMGLAQRTLEYWRRTDRGPRYLRFGHKVVYRQSDLDEFTQQCAVDTSETRAVS
ncbi:helix-turn-helix transcriptional regulator [Mycolicibacterium fallax]|uniref:Uncharacterized protein n=1 Tax=Mycolicibacterium fallax TaxID=1793 RepID=A0A1X1RFI8_MYCFA|nr:helix-turn-helix domain-containing protein [Mycolicibacterium fallax]ORV04606.1 hypothetical protein AWC04_08410 [Mycolicibacterium fallax]BBY99650.1 hypothetical protein MFAL_31170 [Mycolicibacterium fallax]